VGWLRGEPQIAERIANFRPLVESWAANHAVGQADGNEALLELAHLERGAHKDRNFIERMAPALQFLDFLANRAGFLLRIPTTGNHRFSAQGIIGKKRLAEPAFIMADQAGCGGKDMAGRAVIALKPDNFRAVKIALEAQDIVDLGAAPAVDRLIVVAD